MEPAELIAEFDRPPVVETIVGAQFKPIPALKNGHLGAFWKLLGPNWPNIIDQQPLEQQFERFGMQGTGGFNFQLIMDASSRLMIRNRNNDRLIQIQNGRMHLNWIRQADGDYPHYKNVRAEFNEMWLRFRDFLRSELQQECQVNQWEVTYVNRFPRGSVWNEPCDWNRVLTFLGCGNPSCGPFLGLGGEWHFEILPQLGRLHVQLQHGKPDKDSPEALTMTLTARGPVDESKGLTLDDGLNRGREAIVKAFVELTTPEAQAVWEKRS